MAKVINLKKKVRVWNKTAKIRAALRQVFRWSPMRVQALKRARIGRGSYLCAKCEKIFGPKEVQVDHVLRVVSPGSDPGDWNLYVENLFDGDLQVLCKPCHLGKGETGRPRKEDKGDGNFSKEN